MAKGLDITDDLTISGYADARAGHCRRAAELAEGRALGKFRYGGKQKEFGTEGVLQARFQSGRWSASCQRAAGGPDTQSVIDALETYMRYDQSSGDIGWSVKAGRLLSHHQLENDDIGWTSPYTLTPSGHQQLDRR